MVWPFEAPRMQIVRAPVPAPGANWALTPNLLGTWIVQSLSFQLVTSAVVAARTVDLQVTDGNDVWFRAGAPAPFAAATTARFTAYRGANPNVASSGLVTLCWPEPGLILRQGDTLSVVTGLIDVADQYSAISALIQELPSGPEMRLDPSSDIYAEPLGM